jgi:hypothetical protein
MHDHHLAMHAPLAFGSLFHPRAARSFRTSRRDAVDLAGDVELPARLNVGVARASRHGGSSILGRACRSASGRQGMPAGRTGLSVTCKHARRLETCLLAQASDRPCPTVRELRGERILARMDCVKGGLPRPLRRPRAGGLPYPPGTLSPLSRPSAAFETPGSPRPARPLNAAQQARFGRPPVSDSQQLSANG